MCDCDVTAGLKRECVCVIIIPMSVFEIILCAAICWSETGSDGGAKETQYP